MTGDRRAHRAAWARNARRQQAYGRWEPFTDPAPATAHVAWLHDTYSLSIAAIAHLANMPTGNLEQIINPNHHQHRDRIRHATANAILNTRFDLDALAPHHQIHIAGTQRRIRALARIGWSQAHLADRLGITPAAVNNYLDAGRKRVSVAIARGIRDLYDELSMTPGPHAKAATWAARRNWPPPLAWDDEDLDNPHAKPRVGVNRSDRAAQIEDLITIGRATTVPEVAEHLGITKSGVYRALQRAGRTDLLEQLRHRKDTAA